MSGEKNQNSLEMSDIVKKWREEREKRLLERIYGRNRPATSVRLQPISTAVLGIKRSLSESNVRGGQAVGRLSLKPGLLCNRKSELKQNNLPSKSSQQLKVGLSCANENQKRYTIGHNDVNQRRYTFLKCNNNNNNNKVNEFASNKFVKKESLSTKVVSVTKEMKRDVLCCKKSGTKGSEKDVDNKSIASEEHLKADIEDKQNSTFTLTGDDYSNEVNVPSPICKPVTSFVSKKDVIPRPILRQPKSSCMDMSKKLYEWASSKGKSVDNYRHLNCFTSHVAPKISCKTPLSTARKVQFKLSGSKSIFMPYKGGNQGVKKKPLAFWNARPEKPFIAETIEEVNENTNFKENTITPGEPSARSTPEEQPPSDDVAEHLLNSTPVEQPPPPSDDVLKSMTVNALNDLLSLICANYSVEACEEWLLAIRQRNLNADLLPEYWECMAAIEEAKGNMYMALDSYHRAMEHGAEVEHIDGCLDRMYDRLKALNINTVEDKENIASDKAKKPSVYNSAKKDIFKSTVIAFARLQKKVKQCNTGTEGDSSSIKYFVTPVRRSTRFKAPLDSSLLISNTPKTFFKEDEGSQDSNKVEFKTNRALLK